MDVKIEGVEFNPVDYKGRVFREFFPLQCPERGPGWYVYGRCHGQYGPQGIIHLSARPAVKARKHLHYNVMVRRGWHTKREAQAIADKLNTMLPKGA
jgi:hypothetical protein